MKMMMPLLAPAAGVIRYRLPEGAVLAAGDLIASLDLDNPELVTRATPFVGTFPELGPPILESQGVDHCFNAALDAAHQILAGAETQKP
jgi:acetyl-CoA carboxylase / biotin carboxylase 1